MPYGQPSFKPLVGQGASSVEITNLSLPTIDTEVTHTLQDGLREIIIRSRSLATVKIAFVSTESGTKYLTINPGCSLAISGLEFSSKSLYLQSPTVTTVEILELY